MNRRLMKPTRFPNMLLTAALAVGLTSVASADLYEWHNTAGTGVLRNWCDPDNWTVTSGSETPPSLPYATSTNKIQRSASITLLDGDDVRLGRTYLLAGTNYKTLNLTVPSGASLAFDGTKETTFMGNDSWYNGSIANKVFIDVAGTLTLGQSKFAMHGNTGNWMDHPPVNILTVRDGGRLNLTNGVLIIYGGENAYSTGVGLHTNIVNVLKGATLRVSGSGHIVFGSSDNYDPNNSYQGGGEINIKGGVFDATAAEKDTVMNFGTHVKATVGSTFTVSENGFADFGGKRFYVRATSNAQIRATSGGVITNAILQFEHSQSTKAAATACNTLVEAKDGVIWGNALAFATSYGNNGHRTTFRIHGPTSRMTFSTQGAHTPYHDSGTNTPFFVDLRLTAHTPRTADFAVNPFWIRTNFSNTYPYGQYVFGRYRVSPDGGFQLVHMRRFDALVRQFEDYHELTYGDCYGGFVGNDMWSADIITVTDGKYERYVGSAKARSYGLTLKDEARLTDGVALATGVARAWLKLPDFKRWQVRPIDKAGDYIAVRLNLEARAKSVADVVADMKANGHPTACVDESVCGYNVRVDLPVDELAAGQNDDAIVMDFVAADNYAQAKGYVPMVTNALIKAATCDVNRTPLGLVLIVK